MRCTSFLVGFAIVASALAATGAGAQNAPTFEKKNYTYNEWTKGLFSEVVTVTGPGKMIFLAGIGAEEEGATRGVVRAPGDFLGQCRYSYDKIKRLLEKHGATLADVVKMVTYVTDMRYGMDYGKCRVEQFANNPLPAHTLINISQLAWPGMMIEIDVTAMVANK